MLRLTRQVRFAVNVCPDDQLLHAPANSFAGFPSLTGLGHYFALDLTVASDVTPRDNYLINIKQIDDLVRQIAIPLIQNAIHTSTFNTGVTLTQKLFQSLQNQFSDLRLDRLTLHLSPFLSLSIFQQEYPMIRLSQKFEFAASHRLHNPELSDDQNRLAFGKCNNPHGHGHNYELQVTLVGSPNPHGLLLDIPAFEQIVNQTVIEKFDHKNLNVELPEFRNLLPSVENIALVIYRLLKPHFASPKLAAVTVWETHKTWCEYAE